MTTATAPAPARRGRRRGATNGGEQAAGWLFTLPAIVIIGVFLILPILLALWVSFTDWNGRRSPLFNDSVDFVGGENYGTILTDDGLTRELFGRAIRNNVYYVLFVVPLQTMLALFLAVQVNNRLLKAKGFFRTAFYFPSVTSSIAITGVFLFLFSTSGVVNVMLSWVGITGPNWMANGDGVIHSLLGVFGVDSPPAGWNEPGFLGVSAWSWIGGPSVAQCVLIILAVFTTSGTFMLLFLAGLQNVGGEISEAAAVDGATKWTAFWRITLPMLRPTLFTVLTLGLIGTWQVFDQVYLTANTPAAQTLTSPAYMAYNQAFENHEPGIAAAIAFVLFLIIVVLSLFQRWVLRDREAGSRRQLRSFLRAAEEGRLARVGEGQR
ncbi:carbohydrate ABC transporter permease [Microbacterium sediminis]|uniref:ABC transporter permease n=1 Tax=Microbacterium sediminis TaxID=904291 RepID=A0A1B9NAA6_9MICO|nr:sugar ABC transporter permease [Microbacterium sediminis]OCG73513.1 ABC transporter permease [Microbacterium sediminis]QBR73184.1 sugar ABC transporter permease [Microbacterium sediminis]